MSFYQLKMSAGVPYKQETPDCRVLLIDDLGAADSVDVKLIRNGAESNTIPNRKTAFRLIQDFDGAVFTSSVDTVLSVFLSPYDVDLGYRDGAVVLGAMSITNTPNVTVVNNNAAAVPVQQQTLTTIDDYAVASVGTGAALLVHVPALKRLRIRNAHATAIVAIGGAGVTLADSPIQLLPGDIWSEDDAAGAAWYAISTVAATPVQIMGLA